MLKIAPALRGHNAVEVAAMLNRGLAELRGDMIVPRLGGGSIVASDLVFYNSANMTTDSTSLTGGAIDTLRRPDFTQMSGSAETIDLSSSNAGDTTQTVTITGRLADGTLASETKTLTGTTIVTTTNSYERILKAELSATTTGNITVKGHTSATTFRIIPAGERGFQAIFQQLASSPSAGTDWYEKFFIKNTNGSLTLTSAVVVENADPSNVISFALAASLNDSATVANRTTSPGLTFNSTSKNVPNSQNLTNGAAIGVWLDLTLATNNAALKTTWTGEIDGNTT